MGPLAAGRAERAVARQHAPDPARRLDAVPPIPYSRVASGAPVD
jgi:hypothetical protein